MAQVVVLTIRQTENRETVAVENIPNTLQAKQAIVEGLIQPLDLWEDDHGVVSLVVNEEFMGLSLNRAASDLASHFLGQPWPLCGNAFVGRWNKDGEAVSLVLTDLERIQATGV